MWEAHFDARTDVFRAMTLSALDRAAIKKVEMAAQQRFIRKALHIQSLDKAAWDRKWRELRLCCPDCDSYLTPLKRGTSAGHAHCTKCNCEPLDTKTFWKHKLAVVAHVLSGEDFGELWPHILVEPKG